MISIITPVYNGIQFIEFCIQNVINQHFLNVEHIIVDGGSTDGTVEIISQYGKKCSHIKWVSEIDRGQSNAMNKGFAMSRGDIISYLNVDDFYMPNILEKATKLLDRDKGVFFVAGACNMVDLEGNVFIPGSKPRVNFPEMMCWWKAWFPKNPSAYFYYREVQEECGGFDESDHFLMDYDFLLKASLKYDIKAFESVWGNFRWYKGSKSESRAKDISRKQVYDLYKKKLSMSQKCLIECNYFKDKLMRKI